MRYDHRQIVRLFVFIVATVIALGGEYVAVRTRNNGLEFGAIALFVGALIAIIFEAMRDRPESGK